MSDEQEYRPDTPEGPVLDRLVALFVATESGHAEVTRQGVEALTTEFPELAERYGDWNLGLAFAGSGGRLLRADVARKLEEKGLSQRAIAKQLGVSKTAVQRDLAGPSGPPESAESGPSGPPPPAPAPAPEEPTPEPGPTLEEIADASRTENERRTVAIAAWRGAYGKSKVAFGRIDPAPTEEEAGDVLTHMRDVLHRASGRGKHKGMEVVK